MEVSDDYLYDRSGLLLLDRDKPRGDDRPLRSAAAPPGGWGRRSRWRRRSRTPFGLEEIDVVRLPSTPIVFAPGECCDGVHHRVLVGRILMNHSDVALAAVRNVYQLLGWIPAQGIHARPFLIVATTLPVFGSTTTDVLLHPEKIRSEALS